MRPLLLLVLAGATLAGDDLDRHRWGDAVEVAGERYVVTSNTFPELARSLAGAVNRAAVLFEDRFGPLEGKARLPMRIALFRTRAEYLELGGGVEGAVGHYDPGFDRAALVWDGSTGDEGWPVAVHEACHHYLRRRYPRLQAPSWYAEGIACWFEGLIDPTTRRAVSRVRLRSARAALRDGEVDLATLLATRAEVREGKLHLQNYAPGRFYGLAWSLVHFLASDSRTREGFRRFELRLFHSHPVPSRVEIHARRLLEEECGDLARLEQLWMEHLAGLEEPPTAAAAPVYGWELGSPRAFVRYAALRRLPAGALDAALRERAVECLSDGDLIVRTEAARLLARSPAADAVPGLVEALDLGDPALKEIVLTALAHPCARLAVPRLMEEVEHRERALDALARIGDPRAFALLRHAAADPLLDASTRARCARALARDPRARRLLALVAQDADAQVRNAALAALDELGDPPPRRAVLPAAQAERALDLLRDVSAPVARRVHACRKLGEAGVRQAIPQLRLLCDGRQPERLRLAALRALVDITGETRGYEPGQGAREREAVYRAWSREPE